MSENHRIDKWLWSVRLFKTRSLAAEAVRGGKVKLNGDAAKPSKELKVGDEISFRFGPIIKTFKVVEFPSSRVGAPLVKDFCTDLTPQEEYEKLKAAREFEKPFFYNGKGRPTKKDRRKLDERFGDGM
jgi:ribosome-associated heat shock protein Hsp15